MGNKLNQMTEENQGSNTERIKTELGNPPGQKKIITKKKKKNNNNKVKH